MCNIPHMKQDTRQDYEGRMLRVLIHLQRNLDRSPSLEELAEVAHFSPYHFHRIFTALEGVPSRAQFRQVRNQSAIPATVLPGEAQRGKRERHDRPGRWLMHSIGPLPEGHLSSRRGTSGTSIARGGGMDPCFVAGSARCR